MSHLPLRRVPPPAWARPVEVKFVGVDEEIRAALHRHRVRMLGVVHAEVKDYLDNTFDPCDEEDVFGEDEEPFPHRPRMTGTYHIGRESYFTAPPDPEFGTPEVRAAITCHFHEHPRPGFTDEDGWDYLGLEVWTRFDPAAGTFVIDRNTDSSAI